MTVLRYQSTTALDSAGLAFTHGLRDINNNLAVPTEWSFSIRSGGYGYASSPYIVSVNSSQITLAMSSTSTATVDVFVSIPHSEIR